MSTTTRRAGKPTLDLTHPELAAQIHPDSPVQAHEVTYGSMKKPLWVCDEGHTWEATVAHRVRGRACRTCYYSKPHPNKKTLNLTHPELATQIHPGSPIQAHEVTAGSNKKPLWVCSLGHTWEAEVKARVKGYGCRKCHLAPSHRTLKHTHPELAAQIHPDSPIQAHEVTAGSHKKPLWVCEEGHTWWAKVADRANGSGCRACHLTPSHRTLNLTHPELAAQIHPDSPVQAHKVTAGSGKKPLWVCEEGHTWWAKVADRVNGNACRTCHFAPSHRTLNLTHPELAAQIHPDSPVQAHKVTAGSVKEPLWVCDEGHTWEARVVGRVNGGGCKKCYLTPSHRTLNHTHPELAAQIHPDSPVKAHEVTAGSEKKPLWVCEEGHTWWAKVADRANGSGCRACHLTPSHRTLNLTHPELAAQIHPDSPVKAHEVTHGSMKKTLWVCEEGHTWEAAVAHRVNGSGCPRCGSSQGERDVRDYLTTLLPAGVQVVANTRKIIRPLELDMYVPELKLAVEYNGTYWHSDEVILATRGITADEYHNNKKQRCEEQGVTLIFVEEHDWKTNPEQVKQHLQDTVSTALMGTKRWCDNPARLPHQR